MAASPTSAAAAGATVDAALGDDTLAICQQLLRIDTTNPPGRERAAAEYLAGLLREVGLDPVLLEAEPGRTNLVVRLRGTGKKPPLLLSAHLDVVEADPSKWTHPPFAGVIADGCLWGRGAIDMKHMAAMSAAILRRLARSGAQLDRDVIFAAVADEEAGCELGSKFLLERHRSLIEAEFALGEVGGFSLHIGDQTFYPVQVAEKGFCWVKARVSGTPGHGSMPIADSAVGKLGDVLRTLARTRLPVHETPYVRDFLAAIAARQPALARPLARLLARPGVIAPLVRRLPDLGLARSLSAVLSNTASPTVVRAGNKTNVIPGVAEVEIDGRTLPGQTDADLLRELRAVLGADVELEIMRSAPPMVTEPVESEMWTAIHRQIGRYEPDATVVPYLIPGFTDGKYFAQAGARWYGFAPVRLPRGGNLRFAEMFHGHDERIPVDGLRWGAGVLDAVVRDVAAAAG